MRSEGSKREALIVSGLCLAWYSISSASNVVGKVVLTEFSYPMTVTMVQLVSIVIYSAATFSWCGVRREVQFSCQYYWRALVPLAFAKFLTTICSQVSIWKVPISYAHTVKATTPLWTAGLAWALFGERQSRGVQLSLVVIALGVAVASATEMHFDGLGLSAALAAAALLSLQHIFSKRVMRDTGIHHLRLLQLLGRVALMMFTPVWVWCDGLALWEGAEPRDGWVRGGSLLAADGALAWLQAVVAFSVLSRVTPLTYAVASAAKRAVVVAASLVLLRNPASPLNLAGMALALLGVLAYNRAKVQARLNPPRRPLLPV